MLATAFDVLGGMATLNFYRDGVGRRLAIVLTDGETLPVDEEGLEGTLAGAAPVEFLFVRFWGPEERIFGAGGLVEDAYRPDRAAGRRFERFVSAFGAELYEADELGEVARRAREIVGEGPTRQEERVVQEVPLAPYAALGAVLPRPGPGPSEPRLRVAGTPPGHCKVVPISIARTKGVLGGSASQRSSVDVAVDVILGSIVLAGCSIGGDDSEGLSSEQSDAIEETIGVAG